MSGEINKQQRRILLPVYGNEEAEDVVREEKGEEEGEEEDIEEGQR